MRASETSSRQMVVILDGGLCNRIRPALSALYMADCLGIKVYFKWTIGNPGCLCEFSQLFEPTLKLIDIEGFVALKYNDHDPSHRASLIDIVTTGKNIYLRSPDIFTEFHRRRPLGEGAKWMADHIDRYFIPIFLIQEKIDVIASRLDLNATVGVHVRRGDRAFSPVRYRAYFRQIDKRLLDGGSVFLATDDGISGADSEIITRFRRRYGRKLCYQEKTSIDRTCAGVQQGLIDLWLLRRCGNFVGTRGSTFSKVAANGLVHRAHLI